MWAAPRRRPLSSPANTSTPGNARPTEPGRWSHSIESISVKIPASLVPQYSTSRGPHHSIIARFVVGEIGAAPCRTNVSGDGSNARRVASGNRSRRTNMVGTRCVCAIARLSMSSNTEAASNFGIITTDAPLTMSNSAEPLTAA